MHKETPTNTPPTPSNSAQLPAAVITYSESGFNPASTEVRSGDTIAVNNISSQDLQLGSNPHPAHTDNADLNVGTIPSGQTITFIVTKKGMFGYHNHLNPSDTGNITIQ